MIKSTLLHIALATVLLLPLKAAMATSTLYATEAAATAACGTDEVVWINLDKGRFFHKGAQHYGTGGNGGFGCLATAKNLYREGHD